MVPSLPKLRSDLTVSRQQTANGEVYVVKDPDSGKYYRLGSLEYFVARQLDGKTELPTVQTRAEEQFRAPLPIETLTTFIEKLEKTHLLGNGESESSKRHRDDKRIRGNLFYLRYKILDPEQLFNRLIGKIQFLFTPYFIAIATFLVLLATSIIITNWGEFGENLSKLYQFSTIPLLLAVFFVVISLHEFAHGLTCKHFGGEVREMGFMLIYFQPAMYCNVSDAWLFTEKSKRLWVGFAGPFFELFLWALATVVWRATSADTLVNKTALVVMAGSGVKTFFNFNPLIKLDGYYLLSDYLEIPNLRGKAFRYVGSKIKALLGIDSPPLEGISPREKKIFLVYGLFAAIGSFVLMGYVFLTAGEYLLQGNLIAMFLLTVLGVRFRKRFRKMFGGASSSDDIDDDEEADSFSSKDNRQAKEARSESAQHSQQRRKRNHTGVRRVFYVHEDGVAEETRATISNPPELADSKKPPSTTTNDTVRSETTDSGEPRKRDKTSRHERLAKRRKYWAGIAVLVLMIVFFVPVELRVGGPFSILPIHNADVRARIEGMVDEIYVTEGDRVQKDDLIARLSGSEQRSEYDKIAAQIQQAQAKLRMQIAGPTREEIDVARSAVEKARDRLRFARTRSERDSLQLARNLISAKEFENTKELAVIAENDLAEAQNKLDVLLRGTRQEEIDATRAEIASLEAQLHFLQDQLERLEVRSPVAGIVATPARQLREMERQVVQKGALIAKVYNLQTLMVEIPIPEKEIADVHVGQTVLFKAVAYPNETFYGVVTSVGTAVSGSASPTQNPSSSPLLPTSTGTDKTILVTTEIDNTSLLLKPGMTGQAKIYCGERKIIELIIRRIARTVKVEFWSWW